MLRGHSMVRLLGVLLAGSVATAACGGDDDNGNNNSNNGANAGFGGFAEAGSPNGGSISGSSGFAGTLAVGGQPELGGAGGSETGAAGMAGAGGAEVAMSMVKVTNLTSDQANAAANLDPNLVNAWGMSFDPEPAGTAAFWVSAADSGVSTVYAADGKPNQLVVTIPSAAVAGAGTPTGQVYNSTSGFESDKFIFATEDGLIAGWKAGVLAVKRVDKSAAGASYKGLALETGATPHLFAANFHAGTIDVFDDTYAAVDTGSKYVDPTLPEGFAPFNLAVLAGKLYVAYAKQDADKADEVKGPGLGYVNVFKLDGTLTTHLVKGGVLNAPWGLTLSPAGFTPAPSALIVGNFGDGMIHAFDPATGELMSEFADTAGSPLVLDGLWALEFGPKKTGQDLSLDLFFTAGPAEEKHGLFGVIMAQ